MAIAFSFEQIIKKVLQRKKLGGRKVLTECMALGYPG